MQQKETKRTCYHCELLMGLLLMLVTLVGCRVPQPANATAISLLMTPIPTATTTGTATVRPSPSATPSPTTTVTPSPSAMPTATSTPAPTLTPLPTIPPQQRGQVYTDLMSSNGGCTLPCWWGFELGSASLNEVRQLYTALGTYISEHPGRTGISILEAIFVDPQIENGIQVRHSFIAQDGIVIEALVHVVDDPNYQIKPVLQRLGQPSKVWMWTIPKPYQGILPARSLIYYPEQGVFVGYATGGVNISEAVNICFDGSGDTALLLWDPKIWDPEGTKGIDDRADEGGGMFTLEGFPIEDVSNWDAEEFYTILSDPTRSECLETPSNLWSPP